MTKNTVYLSIGSNVGDRIANLNAATDALSNNSNIDSVESSSIYITEPVGGVKQDDFYNQALRVQTTLNAEQLLEIIHQIETNLKRTREVHWGPRTIDLDILFFNDSKIDTSNLTIPHPQIANRRFVLIPLLEIILENDLYKQVEEMLNKTNDTNEVKKL